MSLALIALGSNLGARARTLREAAAELARVPGVCLLACSALHETAAVDAPPGSPPFLNAAALLDTSLEPGPLLDVLLEIERRHGRPAQRQRLPANAPRTLDLDLLLHGQHVIDQPGLVLPHPRAHRRAFVLEPAAEVAAGLRHPLLGATIEELRDALRERAAAHP